MADERDPNRIDSVLRPLPRPGGPSAVRPVVPVRRRELANEAYQHMEKPEGPPAPTDSAHVLVRQVMSRPAIVLPMGASLAEAAEVMRQRDIRHLPVVDPAGRLVGLVTRGNIMERALRGDTGWRSVQVIHAMTRAVATTHADSTIRDAAKVLLTGKHSGMPVVGPEGVPQGFLSARDVLELLVQKAPITLWV